MSVGVAMERESAGARSWTAEQRHAIDAREGDLLLSAGAGSGKTSVLVERFVASVLEDGLAVPEILTLTFTEKAAAEMRDRIRLRLRELGEEAAAAATEGAFIATIHGFCARVLRAHAVAAGLDPQFTVLDELEARRLAAQAFETALETLARGREREEVIDLIAAYTAPALRAAILATHAELRSRGEVEPALPPLAPAPDPEPALRAFHAAAAAAAAELGTVESPGVRVRQALARLERCAGVHADTWPGDLEALALPRGNGAALSTPVCLAYTEALAALREICAHRHAGRVHGLLDRLLRTFARHYREAKRERAGLDFADLELMTRALLVGERTVRERYRARFRRIMVDEFQDTNAVQLELIGALETGNLFTVGDAQQSIYAFRHADVALFERLAERRQAEGTYATLRVNFRSRPEILAVINLAFGRVLGEGFTPLLAGREDPPAGDPRVELLLVDKGADWQAEGLAAPWRVAEARTLARRVAALLAAGTSARDVVVLTRATTDLRTYERALEDHGVPTYLIGGRGYWSHPQVLDLLAYLRALANPRDEEALLAVLASPLLGVSLDALVLLVAAARAERTDPWSWLREHPASALEGLARADGERLDRFVPWLATEREAVGRAGLEALIDRALAATGYDLAVLALPGGRRRLANVRKLMRLAREHETAHGPGLRAFLDAVAERAAAEGGGGARESEAPVEGEALDAVRLMTIHRAKGLEFDVVCVADLGRVRWPVAEILRLGADGRIGLRLAEPGSGRREPALAYRALGEARTAAEEAEERRLFYVALTRARERLVVSGAARLECWPEGNGGTAIGWLAPALVPELGERLAEGSGVGEDGVAFTIVGDDASTPQSGPASAAPGREEPGDEEPGAADLEAGLEAAPAARPATLSYSALADYHRCGYRFYLERVLGLPAQPAAPSARAADRPPPAGRLTAAERGVLAHALLERLDFRRPLAPAAAALARACAAHRLPHPNEEEAAALAGLVGAFAGSELCRRLAAATSVRREQRFTFPLGAELLITGTLDVLARERAGVLVLDYKTDRLAGAAPADLVARAYEGQRLIYALAVLLAGAERVEVAHVFLEAPEQPALAAYTSAELPALRSRLEALAAGVRRREFRVTDLPHRAVCEGCPAEGGLCSWPPELTRRERPDQLF